jgi:hypothetical protein
MEGNLMMSTKILDELHLGPAILQLHIYFYISASFPFMYFLICCSVVIIFHFLGTLKYYIEIISLDVLGMKLMEKMIALVSQASQN